MRRIGNLKTTSSIVLLVILLSGTVTALSYSQIIASGSQPPPTGDWFVDRSTTVQNEPNLIINGSIRLADAIAFTVQNSTITINGGLYTTTGSGLSLTFIDSFIRMNKTGATFNARGTDYWIWQNSKIVSINGRIGDIYFNGDYQGVTNGLYAEKYAKFVHQVGELRNAYFNDSTKIALQPIGTTLTSNITINNYGEAGLHLSGGYNNITGIKILGPSPTSQVAAAFTYISSTLRDFYIECKGMLSPHSALYFGSGTTVNGNVAENGVVNGTVGNFVYKQHALSGTNWVRNVVVDTAYDVFDSTGYQGSWLVKADNITIRNIYDHLVSQESYLKQDFEISNIDATFDPTRNNDAYFLSHSNAMVVAINVTFRNLPHSLILSASSSSFVLQKWTINGVSLYMNSTSTQNQQATLKSWKMVNGRLQIIPWETAQSNLLIDVGAG